VPELGRPRAGLPPWSRRETYRRCPRSQPGLLDGGQDRLQVGGQAAEEHRGFLRVPGDLPPGECGEGSLAWAFLPSIEAGGVWVLGITSALFMSGTGLADLYL